MPKQKPVQSTIHAKDTDISVLSNIGTDDYISLTDIARYRNSEFPADVIKNWLRQRNTIEFLGLWEQLNNPDFKLVEFDQFKIEAGSNTFVLSPQKWIRSTNAIGIISKSGRYGGGTFAHKDIAFEFASWVSPEFKLYIIKDYQRLKEDENHRFALDWNVKRLLSKANYRLHTDAIRNNLILPELTPAQKGFVYAEEADLLNVIMFGQTASEWRKANPNLVGNMRDYATIHQLLVLANLESLNAYFVEQKIPQAERMKRLRQIAETQLKQLAENASAIKLENLHNQPQLLE